MAETTTGAALEDWLLDNALRAVVLDDLVDGMARRVLAAGVPIRRCSVAWSILHPLFDAEAVTWTRADGPVLSQFPHTQREREAWSKSPIRHMLANGLETLRRRLAGAAAELDFPLCEELASVGDTDYVAFTVRFDIPKIVDEDRGIVVSWTTDRSGGFTDGDIAMLSRLNRPLAITCRGALLSRIASNIAETYLGRRAGGDVLAGRIRRGDGHTIRAVIWYSDLRGSTALAESLAPDAYIAMLNRYFEYTAGTVMDAGGEVLDFIGDAVLGVFPVVDGASVETAAAAATEAADAAVSRIAPMTEASPALDFGVALAVGDVMFGNIGIPNRLSFSVIGSTVNAVARIEKMTKQIGEPVLATEHVARTAPADWRAVGSFPLDGFGAPVPLHARARP
ncbi:adenylate/guanylate cyclase domain-containing protein [Pseudoxanthobacter sp. M-2]|uniref:adenylate/guanylate cyclase domain-containing protein n=1 Tax=Pseudoxanthobacter sp. M-2 TaxID=3078754 RepID=UPI0038FC7EC9